MSALGALPVRLALLACLALAAPAATAANMDSSGTAETPAPSPDYALAMDAWEARDWDGVALHMTKAVADAPQADMAWTRLGFAWRRLGNYDKSLAAYDQALKLNPANRGALEYLAEAYLQMNKLPEARAIAARLGKECQRASPSAAPDKYPEGCEELALLKKNFEALGAPWGSQASAPP